MSRGKFAKMLLNIRLLKAYKRLLLSFYCIVDDSTQPERAEFEEEPQDDFSQTERFSQFTQTQTQTIGDNVS